MGIYYVQKLRKRLPEKTSKEKTKHFSPDAKNTRDTKGGKIMYYMPTVFGENLFDDLFDALPFFSDKDLKKTEKKLYGKNAAHIMKTDIKELDNHYELEMDLPGFAKEDIMISLENGSLTIRAAKKLNVEEKDKESGNYIRRERYSGSCSRSFFVGKDINVEDITAEFKHGILKLNVPKVDPAKAIPQKKYVEIAG